MTDEPPYVVIADPPKRKPRRAALPPDLQALVHAYGNGFSGIPPAIWTQYYAELAEWNEHHRRPEGAIEDEDSRP